MNRRLLQAAVALALAAPGAALAQFLPIERIPWPSEGNFPAYPVTDADRPTEIWVQGGFAYDSNIFRLSKDVDPEDVIDRKERSDWYERLGVGIRHESRIVGRQSVRLQARGDQYKYARSDNLDHFAYALRGEWLWEFTNDFSGSIGYERERRLVDLAQRTGNEEVTENHAFVNGAFRLGPNTRIRAGYDWVRSDREDDAFEDAELRSNSVFGGVDYVTPLGNAIGIEYRRTDGNAPFAQVVGGVAVDNEFDEREVAAVLTWTASPQIRATARLGRTKREHDEFPGRDFKGTTGRATIDWQPLNKTAFTFSAYREPRSIIDIGAAFVDVRGFSIGPRWAPREKLVFSAAYVRERLKFSGDPATEVLGTEERKDKVQAIRIGAGWEPKRLTQVGLAYERGKRDSNLDIDYIYNTVMVNLRLIF